MSKSVFANRIIDWYDRNKRDLPWRHTRDPYQIWLSEIILQQTRVAQGLPYYRAFVKQYPSVKKLAAAPTDEVLRLWQGLGYYTRARNLHVCAKKVVAEFHGKFPGSYKELLTLPGVGSYTAAAIASIAFNEPVAVVDGNVFRVLARVFGITENIGSVKGKKSFFEKANELIQSETPGIFNQAVMEFGALQCTPVNPACTHCTLARICVAKAQNLQTQLPVKQTRSNVRVRYLYYIVIRKGNSLFLRLRKPGDIWNGLYDFYLLEESRLVTAPQLLKKYSLKNAIVRVSKEYKHVLSHQKLVVRFIEADRNLIGQKQVEAAGLQLYSKKQVEQLPKPVLILRYLQDEGYLE
ncbi:MAG: A/G-specific adenine glycosylase [Bacteroidetes bacterium CHB5]|nr:A/G-specific adenine glycosylase [Bacteroidetes bacterium CHB5]